MEIPFEVVKREIKYGLIGLGIGFLGLIIYFLDFKSSGKIITRAGVIFGSLGVMLGIYDFLKYWTKK
jgi:hypothetical protein